MWPQDITTAPKDGTEIVAYIKNGAPIGGEPFEGWISAWWFENPEPEKEGWETPFGFIGDPTFWMPYPKNTSDASQVIVPREPTQAMIEWGDTALADFHKADKVWERMIECCELGL